MSQRGQPIAIVVAGLSLFVATAAAGNAPGRAVVADWYDNGKLDRSWSCDRLLDGLTSLSENSRPRYLSMRQDIERQLRTRCAAWKGGASEFKTTPWEATTEFNSGHAEAEIINYRVPWKLVLTGLLAGGLTVLIGAVLASQRRLRP